MKPRMLTLVLFLIEYMSHILNVYVDVFYITNNVFNSMQSHDILGSRLWFMREVAYCLSFCSMHMILDRMHDSAWIGKLDGSSTLLMSCISQRLDYSLLLRVTLLSRVWCNLVLFTHKSFPSSPLLL